VPNEVRRCVDVPQDRIDVYSAVLGRVGREPPGRLLELALAADAVAASGLVPRDRDVDEPLEEVAFLGRRRPPRVLELLVGGEELPATNEVQAAL
jgi:hypothetical protein